MYSTYHYLPCIMFIIKYQNITNNMVKMRDISLSVLPGIFQQKHIIMFKYVSNIVFKIRLSLKISLSQFNTRK